MAKPVIKIKKYRHFDGTPALSDLERLVEDPSAVKSHPFYPLLYFSISWTKYAKRSVPGSQKSRNILYAARKDAAIMSHYRNKLAEYYEIKLKQRGISERVIAYRRVEKATGGGKCNVDFALDAFTAIRAKNDSYVFCFDVSDFFGSLQHDHIEHMWKVVEGIDRLSLDQVIVLKRVTQYAFVEMEKAFLALGIKGDVIQVDGNTRTGYLRHKLDIKRQLCFPKVFRDEIAAAGLIQSWKKRNYPHSGIPQGLPISDLLANIYMLSFDTIAARVAKKRGGEYYRYSDDIIFILPRSVNPRRIEYLVQKLLNLTAPGLNLSPKKTEIGLYRRIGNNQIYKKLRGGARNGISYLGFRYDGTKAYLRNGTISSLHRSFAKISNKAAFRYTLSLPSKSVDEIYNAMPRHRIKSQVGKVENFGCLSNDKKMWTFWTYVKKAEETFSDFGSGIQRQLRKTSAIFDGQIRRSISTAVLTRSNPSPGKTRKLVPVTRL